ncbi:solute carrier family 2, facilitated glucose transporter member 8-like [Amblyomma americanum]
MALPAGKEESSTGTTQSSKARPPSSVRRSSGRSLDIPAPDRRSHEETTSSRLRTSLVAGWAGSLSMGVAIGYSLPASRSLGRARSTAPDAEGSSQAVFWFDMVLPLGALIGALGSSSLAFILGRRRALAMGSLGSLASWLAVAWASAVSWHILAARSAQGVCTGVVSLVVPAYIAEISTAKDRKQCGAHQTGIAAGVLYSYVLGQFTDWPRLALWCAVPPTLTTALLLLAVESPRWLMERGRRADAQEALRRLRPDDRRVGGK